MWYLAGFDCRGDARVVVFEAEGGAACNGREMLTPSWKCVLRARADSWAGLALPALSPSAPIENRLGRPSAYLPKASLTQNCASSRVITMSTSNQSAGPSTSTDNFAVIFNAASTEYARVTGKHLDTHPFTTQLDACDSPNAVSDLLRTQVQAFSKFRKGEEKLMAVLDPTVHILFTFSATLGEGIGLVSPLVSFGMTTLQHHVYSRSHLPRQSLLASGFSSG